MAVPMNQKTMGKAPDSSQNGSISCYQLFSLLLLSRLMQTMLYVGERRVSLAQMCALLFATLIELAASIPAVMLSKRSDAGVLKTLFCRTGENTPKKGAAELLFRAAGLLYFLFFVYIAAGTLGSFADFMQKQFPDTAPTWLVLVTVTAAGWYCSLMGLEGLSRAGSVLLGGIALLIVLMAAVSEGSFDWLNVVPFSPETLPDFWDYALRDLASSWWLPLTALFYPDVRGGLEKTAGLYLASKLLLLESLMLVIMLVMSSFVEVLGYPLLTLGAYARTDFIQHFGAINMLFWTANCVVVLSLYILAASRAALGGRSTGLKKGAAAAAALALAAVSYRLGIGYDERFGLYLRTALIAVLGVLLPLLGLIRLYIGRAFLCEGE